MITRVAAAIIVENEKVLIGKRAIDRHFGGFWELPGGKIEIDETPERCLERELDEELSIKVRIIRRVAEQYFDYGEFKVIVIAFLCDHIEGKLILNDHDDIKWVDLKSVLLFDLVPADIPIIRKFLAESSE